MVTFPSSPGSALQAVDTLVDEFDRADSASMGDSTSGHTWAVTGAGAFAISNRKLTVNTVGNAYAQMELDSIPLELGGTPSWVTGGGSSSSNATLVCGDSTLMTGTPSTWNALHFTTNNNTWALQIVQAGVFTTLANGVLSGIIDGGQKPVWMRMQGNTVVFQTADGVVQSVTDPRIGALLGNYVIFELGNDAVGPLVRWEYLYAKEALLSPSFFARILGATKRFRSTLQANRLLLTRGIIANNSDVLTNLYVSALNNMKTDGVFNAALGFVSNTNYDAAGNLKEGKASDTYSASITPNFALGGWHTVPVTNGTAFAYNAPTSPPSSSRTATLTVEISNTSGGAMGVITWDPVFKFAGKVWTNPANTGKRAATFRWNGTNWICTDISAADY